ncbi:MAG: phosphoglucosamine mutase [Acidobacteria bacterium]|nr:phosphoglucosamine mutase [Candidatus Sulfomarinibacter kjeldsenii]
METLFGTDGIRGRAYDAPLDEDTVRRLGVALANDLALQCPEPQILLAGDTRASTTDLARWLASSFQATGGTVRWAGVLPTPAISHLLRQDECAAGVVISASHNPAEDNGIKILGPGGEKLADEIERHIEGQIAEVTPLEGPGLPAVDSSYGEQYLDLLVASHATERPLAGLHIVVDAANGAGSAFARPLLDRLGARVSTFATDPDGHNINADCGATAPQRLAETVLELGADGGLALDGDADRSVLVDETGSVLDGDDILLAWARKLQNDRDLPGGRVVATVMSNFGLEQALVNEGMGVIRCSVGDREVWMTMKEHGAALGGEQSGHIICSHYGVSGDGLLTGTHLLAIAADRGVPISDLSDIIRLPQVLINVPVSRKLPFEELPRVSTELAEANRRLNRRGRVLLRYSGTERLARVMIEGEDADEIQGLAESIAEAIRSELS